MQQGRRKGRGKGRIMGTRVGRMGVLVTRRWVSRRRRFTAESRKTAMNSLDDDKPLPFTVGGVYPVRGLSIIFAADLIVFHRPF